MKVYLLMNVGEARDHVLECLFALGYAVLASVDPIKAESAVLKDTTQWHGIIVDDLLVKHVPSFGQGLRDHPSSPKVITITRDGSESNVSRLRATYGPSVISFPCKALDLKSALT